ncbi:flagellar protein FlaG [Sporosalibacterium faouarense]|uniref:flagellar protein FlaG n=1 Tax=Sporosalibacterium faouarense TaxID=516123 RepID=UPI00141CC4A2|nr:flagellar protein FlaG [Sporosalibacterium faouarense]MTI46790.1 flagellar protein FlaG [Bacillota bacterium]
MNLGSIDMSVNGNIRQAQAQPQQNTVHNRKEQKGNAPKEVTVSLHGSQPSEEKIIKAIESANKKFEVYDRKLKFSVHEKTNSIIVKIVDSNTDEVIREIPPEKILDMVANLLEMAGIIVDEKV